MKVSEMHSVTLCVLLSAIATAAATIVWTGQASTGVWRIAGNWSTGSVPGDTDHAVFNGTSSRRCLVDQSITVGSLTMEPSYGGTLTFRAPFTVNGSLTLRDTLTIQYNTHEVSHIKGSPVDLSGLRKCVGSYAEFSIDLEAPAGVVQRLIPPTDTSVQITQLRSYGQGTVSVEGDISVGIFDASPGQTFNWNGHNGRFGVFAHGARAIGLGGSEITVWSYVSWSPNGFGRSKNNSGRTNTGMSDLAPSVPWKFSLVWDPFSKGSLSGIWSDPAYYPTNDLIYDARVGNCDASGGLEMVAMRCMDMGGNQNVVFQQSVATRSSPASSHGATSPVTAAASGPSVDLQGRVQQPSTNARLSALRPLFVKR